MKQMGCIFVQVRFSSAQSVPPETISKSQVDQRRETGLASWQLAPLLNRSLAKLIGQGFLRSSRVSAFRSSFCCGCVGFTSG
jgi:hypothetical protein